MLDWVESKLVPDLKKQGAEMPRNPLDVTCKLVLLETLLQLINVFHVDVLTH